MHFIQWGVLLLIVGTLCHNLSLCHILMHHYRSSCILFCIIMMGFVKSETFTYIIVVIKVYVYIFYLCYQSVTFIK